MKSNLIPEFRLNITAAAVFAAAGLFAVQAGALTIEKTDEEMLGLNTQYGQIRPTTEDVTFKVNGTVKVTNSQEYTVPGDPTSYPGPDAGPFYNFYVDSPRTLTVEGDTLTASTTYVHVPYKEIGNIYVSGQGAKVVLNNEKTTLGVSNTAQNLTGLYAKDGAEFESNGELNITVSSFLCDAGYVNGIRVENAGVSLNGATDVSANAFKRANSQDNQNTTGIFVKGQNASMTVSGPSLSVKSESGYGGSVFSRVIGIDARNGSNVTITPDVKDVTVTATGDALGVTGIRAAEDSILRSDAENLTVSANNDSDRALVAAVAAVGDAEIEITGRKAVITATSARNLAAGVETTKINVDSAPGLNGGSVTVNAELTQIKADRAVNSVGGVIRIDAAEDGSGLGHVAQIDGLVRAITGGKAYVNLEGGDAYLRGQATYQRSQAADQQGILSMTVADGAKWYMTDNSDVTNMLAKTGGNIYLAGDTLENQPDTSPDAYRKLEIGTLTGEGGNFYLRTDIAANQTDTVTIDSGTGAHKVFVKNTGAEPEVERMGAYLVRQETGDADFTLGNAGQAVDAGVYRYVLKGEDVDGGREWHLVRMTEEEAEESGEPSAPAGPGGVLTPEAETVLSLGGMNAQYAFHWHQLEDLRERLGEVRYGANDGLWVRVGGARENIESFGMNPVRVKTWTVNIGADRQINKNWLVGASFKHADLRQMLPENLNSEKSHARSEGLNVYGTWTNEAGWYTDLVFSADAFRQHINARMSDGEKVSGNYGNLGVGISAEVGRKFDFGAQKQWFAEPQAQLAFYHVHGDDYSMSNGMKVSQDNYNSLAGRLGVAAGRTFLRADGSPAGELYLRTGVKQEFSGKQHLTLNGERFTQNDHGTSVYYGFAGDWQMTSSLRFWATAEREHGKGYRKQLSVTAGLKLQF